MVQGEVNIRDAMNCGIQLMAGLARLTAAERAVVEASVVNDMVRIVSEVYKNSSAFGEFEIYRDGNRLNAVWQGTSYDHEAWGAEAREDPKAEVATGELGLDTGKKVTPEDTGRWRFSCFLGHLGDFLNLFFSDPIGTLEAGAKAPSGKARVSVGPHGGVLIQSVDQIVLERCVKIPVPVKEHRWDNPKGTKGEDFENDDVLRVWDNHPGDMHEAAFFLRQQARWLAGYGSMQRFWNNYQRDERKDWSIPSGEGAIEWPRPDGGEEDRRDKQNVQTFYHRYATIRIMSDCSIVVLDGYGSSVRMGGGDIQLAAARNLHVSAAGSMVFEAGQDMAFHARRNVEVVSDKGGMTLKSTSYLTAACESGQVWIRSDAKAGTDGYYPTDSEPSKEAPEDGSDPAPIRVPDNYGVVIEAGRAGMRVHGKRLLRVDVAKEFVGAEGAVDGDRGIYINSGDKVQITGYKNVSLRSQAAIGLTAVQGLIGKGSCANFEVSNFAVGKMAMFRGGSLHVSRVIASSGTFQSVQTRSGRVGKIADDALKDSQPKPLGKGENDDELIGMSLPDPEGGGDDTPVKLEDSPREMSSSTPVRVTNEALAGVQIGFGDPSFYLPEEIQWQDLTEQRLREFREFEVDDVSVGEKVLDWDPSARRAAGHFVKGSDTMPFPGAKKWKVAANYAPLDMGNGAFPDPAEKFEATQGSRQRTVIKQEYLGELLLPDSFYTLNPDEQSDGESGDGEQS
jgi:hypothetical protein